MKPLGFSRENYSALAYNWWESRSPYTHANLAGSGMEKFISSPVMGCGNVSPTALRGTKKQKSSISSREHIVRHPSVKQHFPKYLHKN